jgi:hypothetical protein
MMDIINVLKLILKAMVTIERMVTLDGESKKNSVITYMRENLPEYEKYKEIIPIAIELVIILSRQKRVAINLKKFNCIS